jgi:predicted chitinase
MPPVPPPGPEPAILKPGDSGDAVLQIQQKLASLGFGLGRPDGDYGPKTRDAVTRFQQAKGLTATGFVDAATLTALGFSVDTTPEPARPAPSPGNLPLTTDQVARLFPGAPRANIERFWPYVYQALQAYGIADSAMVLMALATIRAETEGFAPIDEYQSKYNTAPGGKPFALYDNRRDLGNGAAGDGARYKGRGFIQLTGKFNYQKYSQELGLGDLLIREPQRANDPEIAAHVLASFLKNGEGRIRQALSRGDLAAARKVVNGGTHGLDRFRLAFEAGAQTMGLA